MVMMAADMKENGQIIIVQGLALLLIIKATVMKDSGETEEKMAMVRSFTGPGKNMKESGKMIKKMGSERLK